MVFNFDPTKPAPLRVIIVPCQPLLRTLPGYALANFYPRISRIRDQRQDFEGCPHPLLVAFFEMLLVSLTPGLPGLREGIFFLTSDVLGIGGEGDHAAGASGSGSRGADAVLVVRGVDGEEMGYLEKEVNGRGYRGLYW